MVDSSDNVFDAPARFAFTLLLEILRLLQGTHTHIKCGYHSFHNILHRHNIVYQFVHVCCLSQTGLPCSPALLW